MKTRTNKIAYVFIVLCLLCAGVLLYCIFSQLVWGPGWAFKQGEGTRLEFRVEGNEDAFIREKTLYTEDSWIDLTGKLSANGEATLRLIANADNKVVYEVAYSNVQNKRIRLNVNGLQPHAYYTLEFSAVDSPKGYLLLTGNQALVKKPEQPPAPEKGHKK